MATSGSTNYTQTRDQIILDAFQLLGIYGVGRTVSAEDMTFAVSMLNKMVKAWETKGLHLWTKEEAILFVAVSQASYILGSTANAALASDVVITQLNGALATSATAVTVDSTTSMTVGDYIGVVLTDKTVHWTTIATLPSSTTLTLTTGVASAAADNNVVYTYTTRITKPMRILSCRRVTGIDSGTTTTQSEIPLSPMSYSDYFDMPTKTINGTPNQWYYNPNLASGTIYLWSRPSDGNERIHFTMERMIEDLDNTSDNFDFPTEWLECLTYQLAVRLGSAFGKGAKVAQEILPLASVMLDNLLDWDSEISHVQFSPDLRD